MTDMSILPAGVEIVAKFLKVLAALVATLLVFGATVAQIVLADPPLEWPTSLGWFLTPRNISILLTALLSGAGVWALVAQARAPASATDEDMQIVLAKLAVLEARLAADPNVTDTAARSFGIAVEELVRSADPGEQAAAVQIAEGNPISAADRLMEEVRAAKIQNADRARRAARIYAPFSVSKALAAYAEAAEIDPSDVWTWIELRRLHAKAGATAEARRCAERAEQYASDPRDMAVVQNELGEVAIAEGRLEGARGHHQRALEAAQAAATRHPEDWEWQRDISVAHHKLGYVAWMTGDLDEARHHYSQDLAISERLAKDAPPDRDQQRHLAVALDRMGDVAWAVENLAEARAYYGRSFAITERLQRKDPDNGLWKADLGASHNLLGDLERTVGNMAEARGHYLASLAIWRSLSERDASNAEYQRAASITLNALGDVEVAAGNKAEAKAHFTAALALRKRLADADPEDDELKRAIAVTRDRLGDLAVEAGALDEARDQFLNNLDLRVARSAQDPDHVEWRRDVFISHAKLAYLAEVEGNPLEALQRYTEAERVIAELVRDVPTHPGLARDLDSVRSQITRLAQSSIGVIDNG